MINKNPLQNVFSPLLRKFEVNHEASQSKGKQPLYKDISIPTDTPLEQRLFQVVQKPNLRVYCSTCELELTRLYHIITKNQYYCILCFANLQQFLSEYIVRPSLKMSPTSTSWDLMDEVILTTAIKNWGYSNWAQIKQFMDYNQAAFSLQEIRQHYFQYHYNQPNNLLHFPEQIVHAVPHTPYGELTLKNYEQTISSEPKISALNKKQSKCEKKPNSNRNILSNESQGGLKPSVLLGQMSVLEAESRLLSAEVKSDCPVLGYNAKRGEFQTWFFDPQAEKILDDLQFYQTDTPEEHALKISLIEEYNRRLQERTKRKKFVLEYKLLDTHYQISLKPEEQNASAILQPFMRFTENHQEFKQIIDKFTTISKQQSFISNLYKIKQKATKHASLEEGYQFLLQKRKRSIKNWEENYGKPYHDKRRKIYKKKKKQEGSIVLANQNTSQQCSISIAALENAFKQAKRSGSCTFQGLKITPISMQMQLEPESMEAEPVIPQPNPQQNQIQPEPQQQSKKEPQQLN